MQLKIRFLKIMEIRIITLTRISDADRQRTEAVPGNSHKSFGMMVARDGVEPPTSAFSEKYLQQHNRFLGGCVSALKVVGNSLILGRDLGLGGQLLCALA